MQGRYWKILHWFLIINLVAESLYGFYMVFFVIGGSRWPLFARAVNTPVEVILKRRLYAIEAWVALGALTIYLAITEILPRRFESWNLPRAPGQGRGTGVEGE